MVAFKTLFNGKYILSIIVIQKLEWKLSEQGKVKSFQVILSSAP